MRINTRLFFVYTAAIFEMFDRSLAKHVLPVFKDLWYDMHDGCEFVDLSACGGHIYRYQLFSYTDLMHSLPQYPDCAWDYNNPAWYSNSTTMPSGFITMNPDDWNEIIANPNAAITQHYDFYCKQEDGTTLYRDSIYMVPFYDCPANARIGIDEDTNYPICNDEYVPCVADVVARDLKISGAESCGHVGLVTSFLSYELNVLEVLADPAGIFLTPLYGENNSFVSATKYWGDRYGLPNFPLLGFFTAEDIIAAGMDQMQYDFNYTYFYDYYPGGTDESPNNCLFRCDSFVLWAYLANNLLVKDSFSFPDSPKTIFNSFICSADPEGNCPTHYENQSLPLTLANKMSSPGICDVLSLPSGYRKVSGGASDIFRVLRPILRDKEKQRLYLPSIMQKYQQSIDINAQILFARCLCFELKKASPENIDDTVRMLIAGYLWLYRTSIHDNFSLSLLMNQLNFYVDNPQCQWLQAFCVAKTSSIEEKYSCIRSYIDGENNAINKAHLLSSAGSDLRRILPANKKCEYGKFFQEIYNHDKNLTQKDKKIIWSALALLGTYSAHEAAGPNIMCRNISRF